MSGRESIMAKDGPTITVDPQSSVWDFPEFGRLIATIAREFQERSPEAISVRFKEGMPNREGFVTAEMCVTNELFATVIRTTGTMLIRGYGATLQAQVGPGNDSVIVPWDHDEQARKLLARCIAYRLTQQWVGARNEHSAKDRAIRTFDRIGMA